LLLTIEKLVYGGDGLARLPADSRGPGKAVFVPFVLAGEKIEASIIQEKPGFTRALATAIVEPSPHRIEPPCPYFGGCGGCHYQHAAYDHQLAIKKEILRENLRRIARIELQGDIQVHPSPPWNYRNRSRLRVQIRPEFAAGYFKLASHELLPVEQCPISSPLINLGISALWRMGRAGKVAEGVREVEFFANADDSKMLAEIWCSAETPRAAARAFGEDLCAALPRIEGATAFCAAPASRRPSRSFRKDAGAAVSPLVTVGASELIYQTGKAAFRVSAGAFFQTNRFLIDELPEIVSSGRSGELALDLYAGVGLFSTALASFRHTISVESSQTSAGDLQHNLPRNGKAVHATAEQYLTAPGKKARSGDGAALSQLPQSPDLVVVDPPRTGLGNRVSHALATLGAPRVTYVSCDPATLARDLIAFQAAGYRVDQVHVVDLFPQTFHIESVVQLVR